MTRWGRPDLNQKGTEERYLNLLRLGFSESDINRSHRRGPRARETKLRERKHIPQEKLLSRYSC